ncbi:MAG: MFS transporter [Acetobacteraceae bacterium]
MSEWISLLGARRFRAFWLALLANNLGSWCVIAALPILVADRYGVGAELVLSLGFRVLPKIVLAPVAGGLLRAFGPMRVSGCALAAMGVLTALVPWSGDFLVLQGLITLIGVLDVFTTPGLLSLRAPVTPAGLEMAGNTLCSVADRLAKIVGPVIGGLVVLAGFVPAFFLFGAMTLLAAATVARLPIPRDPPPRDGFRGWQLAAAPIEFVRMLRADAALTGLLICAVSYMVMLGGLRPFLFWANRDWYGASDSAWTGLLAAQGAGALVGALLAGLLSGTLLRRISAYTLTLLTGILEGTLHLALLLAATSGQAMLILALASIPEIISTASWFTAMQQRVSAQRQAVFFSFATPLWDVAYVGGVLSAGLVPGGTISLAGYWAMISLASTLPILPVLILSRVRRP